MTFVFSQITIDRPAEAAWQVLSDFAAACNYLSAVVECRVEGVGVGAQRILTSADGSTIVERLVSLDSPAHRLSYLLLSDTPFRECLTTVSVRDLGPGKSEAEWSAAFEAEGIPANEAEDILAGFLAANCLALKQFLER